MSNAAKVWSVIAAVVLVWWGAILYTDNKVTCQVISSPAYQSTTQNNADMYVGENKVTQTGVNGTTKHCYSKVKTVSDTVITYPVAQITDIGTKPKPTPTPIVTYSEPVYNYSQCPITTCNDGSCSSSTGRGTCSWHGGVASYN